MKYGFIPPQIDSTQYVLGGFTSLPKVILEPTGQWDKYLPEYEPQHENFETYGCTVWGTLNAIEILEKRLTTKESNYSERYIYNIVPIRPPGGDPHAVADAIREAGLIPDEPTPATFAEFCMPPTQAQINIGGEWGRKWNFGYEWVFNNVSKTARVQLMKEALMYSPICVSVTAWHEEDGIYVDKGQINNHWTVVYGYTEANGKVFWKVFDSYDHSHKILHPDHEILYCKRYSLTPVEKKDNWLIALIKKYLGTSKPQIKVPDVVTPVAPVKSSREKLYETAVACLGTDASPNDAAPDELGCAETVNEIYYKAFGEYIETPGLSTTKLFAAMLDRADKFVRVTEPEAGNIIISPTGFSKIADTPIKNGHVGIFGKEGKIMSNSSATGKFIENFTIDSWVERYKRKGGYPIYYFKRV